MMVILAEDFSALRTSLLVTMRGSRLFEKPFKGSELLDTVARIAALS